MKVKRDPKLDMYYRERSSDRECILEGRREYTDLAVAPGDTVLDLGANVGGFARYVLDKGARVVAVEPHPDTFGMLTLNVPNAECINLAVAAKGVEFVDMYATPTPGRFTSYSTMPKRGRIKVATGILTTSLPALVGWYKPTVIKIDVEGTEYDILPYKFPSHVRAVAVEFHLGRKAWSESAWQIISDMNKQFDEVPRYPRYKDSSWQTTGVWVR